MQTEGGLRDASRASKGWTGAVLGLLIGAIRLEDFNGDGEPDLATANASSNDVTVLPGHGRGGFTPTPGTPFGQNVEEVCRFLYA
jgi:lysophospholipase L1-like esterase